MSRVGAVVGHGITVSGVLDLGAGDPDSDWNEQNAGDIATQAFVKELRRHDVTVPVNESYTDDGNYVESVEECNDADVDLAVSFHHDWYKAPLGFFCHWWPGSEEGKRAADLMWDEIAHDGWAGRSSWHKPRDLYFVRETDMPAVLVELGRIGQYTEDELVRLGHVLAHAVLRWFGIAHKPHYDKDVAVIWQNKVDRPLAHQLGDEFLFHVDQVPQPNEKIKYAVLVGAAQEFEAHFPESTKVFGTTAVGTGLAVKEALKRGLEDAPDREAPWPEGIYVDR